MIDSIKYINSEYYLNDLVIPYHIGKMYELYQMFNIGKTLPMKYDKLEENHPFKLRSFLHYFSKEQVTEFVMFLKQYDISTFRYLTEKNENELVYRGFHCFFIYMKSEINKFGVSNTSLSHCYGSETTRPHSTYQVEIMKTWRSFNNIEQQFNYRGVIDFSKLNRSVYSGYYDTGCKLSGKGIKCMLDVIIKQNNLINK